MRDDTDCRCYVDHLIAEHRRLHGCLRQMRVALAHSLGSGDSPSFAPVEHSLSRLREELARHFAEEDAGGCLEEAVSRCPRLAAEAGRIEAEHPQILADLDRLAAKTRQLAATHEHQLAVERDFERLCQRLREHEKAENSLLAQGFGIAINGEDTARRPLILDV